jgi:outer membrane protein assembly factor BamB
MAYDLESGEKKWTFSVSHGSYNMLTVNPVTGDVYFGTTTAGDFFAVNPDGEQKWQFPGLGSMKSGAPAVSKDGQTVYAGDATGKIVAIDAATGAEKWNASVGSACAGILVNGDEILVGAYSATNTVSFLKASDGTVIKQINCKASMTDISGFAVSADLKTAYFGNTGGGVSAVSLETHEMLVDNQTVGENNMYEPVVAPNGDVFFGCKDSKCYLVDGKTMEKKATFDPGIGANNGFNYSHPVVDTEGNFYVSSGQIQNQNYILDPALNMKDSWQYDGSGNKQMGGNNYLDGVLYSAFIGANGANGLFVGKYVGGTRYNAHGIDICGSCCIK